MTRAKKSNTTQPAIAADDESFVMGKGPMAAGLRSIVIGDVLTAGDDECMVGGTLFGEKIPDEVRVLSEVNPTAMRWLLNRIARHVLNVQRRNLENELKLIDAALEPGVKPSRRDFRRIDEAFQKVVGE